MNRNCDVKFSGYGKSMEHQFSLLENAKDFLKHAVEHLTNHDHKTSSDFKYAIRDIAQVVELLLKEALRRIHPAFVYQNIDDYPNPDAFYIQSSKALSRYQKLSDKKLDEKHVSTIKACRDMRNEIEHKEIKFHETAARGIIGRMLSFIFYFSNYHLNSGFEKELREDDRWNDLLEIHEFWKAHGDLLEKQLQEQMKHTLSCPHCGRDTYEIESYECKLCGKSYPRQECISCHNTFYEYEMLIKQGIDGDETGVYPYEYYICEECDREREYQDALAESYRSEMKEREGE